LSLALAILHENWHRHMQRDRVRYSSQLKRSKRRDMNIAQRTAMTQANFNAFVKRPCAKFLTLSFCLQNASCVGTTTTTQEPAPRLIREMPATERETITLRVEEPAIDLPGPDQTMTFSLRSERRCQASREMESGGTVVETTKIKKSEKIYHRLEYLVGVAGLASIGLGIGINYSKYHKARSGHKESTKGDNLIGIGSVGALLLVPAIWASARQGQRSYEQPKKKYREEHDVSCEKNGRAMPTQLSIGTGVLHTKISFDEDGVAQIKLADLVSTFSLNGQASGDKPGAFPQVPTHGWYATLDEAVGRSGGFVSNAISELPAILNRYSQRRALALRVEQESKTEKCSDEFGAEQEKYLNVLATQCESAGVEVRQEFVAQMGGRFTEITLKKGGVYEALVTGAGLKSATWFDRSGKEITVPSQSLSGAPPIEWKLDTRRLVVGDDEKVRINIAGQGCGFIFVCREKAVAPATGAMAGADLLRVPERDEQGRRIIRGPISHQGTLENVHIVSDSVGVIHESGTLEIRNSVISAPVCVQANGMTPLSLFNNELNCNLCIQYTGGIRMGQISVSNVCTGYWSNE
jgi:hypothetical protein